MWIKERNSTYSCNIHVERYILIKNKTKHHRSLRAAPDDGHEQQCVLQKGWSPFSVDVGLDCMLGA